LFALGRAVVRGPVEVTSRRLGGGIGTATSAVTIRTRSGKRVEIVLKRYPRARHPDAAREFKRLTFARRLDVPSPEPIALDHGEWFGVPALVMSKLPGRANVAPPEVEPWADEIARVQVAIHAAADRGLPAVMQPRSNTDAWALPDDLPQTPDVEQALEILSRRITRAGSRDVVVGHGDAHPGNMVWSRGRISGVTDWQHARLLPRGHEVAYMRADMAVLVGPRAADAFLAAYEGRIGSRVLDLHLWDIRQALGGVRWAWVWTVPYREQGAELTESVAKRRAAAFLRRAIARFEQRSV
jgi:aminoglycoside phosphotransferase (APT) family kinase protein